ncbi:hypothetical protein BLOT_003787 [Blomia tropicalis]|nr:hypothetical protein BLOT_003787 [Blomia tropicalis]
MAFQSTCRPIFALDDRRANGRFKNPSSTIKSLLKIKSHSSGLCLHLGLALCPVCSKFEILENNTKFKRALNNLNHIGDQIYPLCTSIFI